MKALLVDNTPDLREAYAENIRLQLEDDYPGFELLEASTVEEGLGVVRTEGESLTLVIIDMLFPPVGYPDAPEEKHVPRGLEIARLISKTFPKITIVGLSVGNLERFPHLERSAYESGVDLFVYRSAIHDPGHYGWDGFGGQIKEFLAEKQARTARGSREDLENWEEGDGFDAPSTRKETDVLVFVALGTELDVLKRRWTLQNRGGEAFWSGTLPGGATVHVLPAHGAGRVRAAVTTLHYLLESGWTSDLVAVLGICGGFADQGVEVGDVIVPQYVIDMGTRKVRGSDHPEFRPTPYPLGGQLLDYVRSGDFRAREFEAAVTDLEGYPAGRRPTLRDGESLICTDEVVSSHGWQAALLGAWPKAWGIEMEAGGVAAALAKSGRGAAELVVARGVSDLADPLKADDHWRRLAMSSAAIVLEMYANGARRGAKRPETD